MPVIEPTTSGSELAGQIIRPRLVLDSGALIGLENGDQNIRAIMEKAVSTGIQVLVPAVVLAEVVRNRAQQVNLNRYLKRLDIIDSDGRVCIEAGELLAGLGGGAPLTNH